MSCSKEYSLETTPEVSATGTLKDSSGNCLSESVAGTYYDGVIPGDTNYVQLEVNVSGTGSYNIHTDLQNGFEFSDSGFFTTAGINIIKLKVSGTPILQVATAFTVTFDSTSCIFSVNVKDSTGSGLGGNGGMDTTSINQSDTAWQLYEGGNYYHGSVDSAATLDSLGFNLLYLQCHAAGGSDSVLSINFILPSSMVTTGAYSTVDSAILSFTEITTGNIIYQASPSTIGVETLITLSSYNSSTGVLTGNFAGTALNGVNATVNISGRFYSKSKMMP